MISKDELAARKIEKISKEMDEGKRKAVPLDSVLAEAGINSKSLWGKFKGTNLFESFEKIREEERKKRRTN